MTDHVSSRAASSYERSTSSSSAGVYIPSRTSTQTTQELLYVTVGVVLGSSLLTLVTIMFVCYWRQRQRQHLLGISQCFVCVVRSTPRLIRSNKPGLPSVFCLTKCFCELSDIWFIGRGRRVLVDRMPCDPIQG